jgi:hypothetical protein
MVKFMVEPDEWLKSMAAQAVAQGDNIRANVRDLTLKALHGRELTISQIKRVLQSVTAGVNLGAMNAPVDVDKVLAGALKGMDDALLKAVQASHLTLRRLTGEGRSFEESQLKRALDELTRMEDAFLRTVRQASGDATDTVRGQWAGLLKQAKLDGTLTGAGVATTVEEFGERLQSAIRDSREAGLRAAHMMTQSFAALASGTLIGLTEGLQGSVRAPAAPRSAATPKAPAKRAAKPARPAKKKAAKRKRSK